MQSGGKQNKNTARPFDAETTCDFFTRVTFLSETAIAAVKIIRKNNMAPVRLNDDVQPVV